MTENDHVDRVQERDDLYALARDVDVPEGLLRAFGVWVDTTGGTGWWPALTTAVTWRDLPTEAEVREAEDLLGRDTSPLISKHLWNAACSLIAGSDAYLDDRPEPATATEATLYVPWMDQVTTVDIDVYATGLIVVNPDDGEIRYALDGGNPAVVAACTKAVEDWRVERHHSTAVSLLGFTCPCCGVDVGVTEDDLSAFAPEAWDPLDCPACHTRLLACQHREVTDAAWVARAGDAAHDFPGPHTPSWEAPPIFNGPPVAVLRELETGEAAPPGEVL